MEQACLGYHPVVWTPRAFPENLLACRISLPPRGLPGGDGTSIPLPRFPGYCHVTPGLHLQEAGSPRSVEGQELDTGGAGQVLAPRRHSKSIWHTYKAMWSPGRPAWMQRHEGPSARHLPWERETGPTPRMLGIPDLTLPHHIRGKTEAGGRCSCRERSAGNQGCKGTSGRSGQVSAVALGCARWGSSSHQKHTDTALLFVRSIINIFQYRQNTINSWYKHVRQHEAGPCIRAPQPELSVWLRGGHCGKVTRLCCF